MIDKGRLDTLERSPTAPVRGRLNGSGYTARIAIADYGGRIAAHYAEATADGLPAACRRAGVPFGFTHFGLILAFDAPVELRVHDREFVLDETVRAAVARFGPVLFRNASIDRAVKAEPQRNIFPDLRFHIDRGGTQPNLYSLYTRDRLDPVQREPRTSSTVFVANIVAYLQFIREGQADAATERGLRGRYDLFRDDDFAALIGDIVLEQRWDAPAGTGEIGVIDNRTVLHASYYRDGKAAGYPIGTRYLY